MLHTKLIKDLDQLRVQAFPPPFTLIESIEDVEGRGEAWRVLMAFDDYATDAQWVAMFPDSEEAWFYANDEHMSGRWDQEHEIFFPDDGSPLNLLGKPVSLASILDSEEEEDAEAEEKKR